MMKKYLKDIIYLLILAITVISFSLKIDNIKDNQERACTP
tara:strand:- start:2013 stop:2132 length:120 start_codon:yes stop_codon:yes gene_type:complete